MYAGFGYRDRDALSIGGLNWGLVEADKMTPLSRTMYALVGLSALYQLPQWNAMRRRWTMAQAHG